VPPTKFGDEKYAVQLVGKVLNAVDELGDRAIRRDSFKSVITGEPVAARDLYRSATFVRPVALNVFSTNTLPSFGQGVDGGVLRRLLPVEFHTVIPESERIPNIGRRICEQEPDLLLKFAVDGAARLLQQGAFTVPASSRELLDRWAQEVDVVRAWVAERLEITKEPVELSAHEAYQDFVAFCTSRGTPKEYIPRGPGFGRRLKAAAPELKAVKANTIKYVNARLRTGSGSSW
jgi:phage/plasmid-associated DNA primase